MRYIADGTPLVILAGAEYGTGSSRDWAAKGTLLLGVRAVIAASYERIHRSNLVGMGILPLQFADGESWQSLGLTGFESFDIGVDGHQLQPRSTIRVKATNDRWQSDRVRNGSAHRYTRGTRLLQQRRHSTDRATQVGSIRIRILPPWRASYHQPCPRLSPLPLTSFNCWWITGTFVGITGQVELIYGKIVRMNPGLFSRVAPSVFDERFTFLSGHPQEPNIYLVLWWGLYATFLKYSP